MMLRENINLILRKFESLIDRILNVAFDFYYRVETRQMIEPSEMDIDEADLKDTKRYQGSHVRILRKAFREIGMDLSGYHFIDLGSGKGRAMFIASLFGVKKCIGIEIAHKIQEICKKNIDTFCRRTGIDREKFELFQGNAMDYNISTSNNLIYLFNPFNLNIVELVAQKLKNSSLTPGTDIILSINPRSDSILNSVGYGCFKEIPNRNPSKTIRFYRLSPDEIPTMEGF